MKEPFGLFLASRQAHSAYEELFQAFGSGRTLMEQRLHKILCSVYKLVNHKTNPECVNELISSRETTYTLRGKDNSTYFNSIYELSLR